jgi:gluconokinase
VGASELLCITFHFSRNNLRLRDRETTDGHLAIEKSVLIRVICGKLRISNLQVPNLSMERAVNNILVIDIGSSSTRALVFDAQATLIPGLMTRRPLAFKATSDGGSEDDARQAFERLAQVLDELQPLVSGRKLSIQAAGISAYACSLVCLDEQGEPLTPVYTYADTRSAGDAHDLRNQFDEVQALQRTGCRIRANYLPGRIAWLRRTQPDVFARTRWFASLSDYLTLRLFGTLRGGLSVWSWSGLVNRQTGDWDADWLSQLGISAEQLPPLAAPGEWLGPACREWAARWPMLKEVLCLPAVGDGAAANIGSGCASPHHVAVTVGSTAAMRIVRPAGGAQQLSPALWCYRVDDRRELIGGATTEGGNVFAWLRQTLQLPDPDALDEAIRQMPPDAHGLTILPLFAGERSPGYSENSRATLHGLTFDVTPVALARACLEAIAYRLGMIYADLKVLAQPGATLVASGGALLASPTWCQIIADVTNAPLVMCEEPEATSRGVALLVLERAQNLMGLSAVLSATDLLGFTRLDHTYQPDPQRHAIYQAAMARQKGLYEKLVSV